MLKTISNLTSKFNLITSTKMTLKHEVNIPFQKATFGLGCFWSGDCQFGVLPGVLRTCVGYAGGEKLNPVYRNIGDHTECIQIDFDPEKITYSELLKTFWNSHEYGLATKLKKQYSSLILYHDEEQKKIAELSKKEEEKKRNVTIITEIRPVGTFYPAEDYHQKYRLQRHPFLTSSLKLNHKLLQTSYVAARLNGYVVGLGGIEQFENELPELGLDEKTANYVRKEILNNKGGTLYC